VPEPIAPSARLYPARPATTPASTTGSTTGSTTASTPEPHAEPRLPQSDGAPDTVDPAFWERRFDDPPRPAAARRANGGGRRDRDWRDRLVERGRDLLADTRAGVVVLVVVAVVAGFVWYRLGTGGDAHGDAPTATASASPTTVATSASAPTDATAGQGAATKAASGRMMVHVAGAVTHPGVVELAAGARVIDAIEAVGGALPDGDLDRLNLAAKLADGERVYVGKPGVADPGAASGAAGDAGSGAAAPGGKVNLNTATQAQLEELPGVGPAFAQAILAERQRRGGFTSVNDLRSVRGIGEKRFADLSPLVTV